jgi:hypothetical protein
VYTNSLLLLSLYYRYNEVRVHESLFDTEAKVKFRGTHLLNEEEADDYVAEESFPQLAWSYGRESTRAESNARKFEQALGPARAGNLNPHTVYSKDQMDAMMLETQVKKK